MLEIIKSIEGSLDATEENIKQHDISTAFKRLHEISIELTRLKTEGLPREYTPSEGFHEEIAKELCILVERHNNLQVRACYGEVRQMLQICENALILFNLDVAQYQFQLIEEALKRLTSTALSNKETNKEINEQISKALKGHFAWTKKITQSCEKMKREMEERKKQKPIIDLLFSALRFNKPAIAQAEENNKEQSTQEDSLYRLF